MSRLDALLQDLQARHRNDHPGFLASVRPLAAAIPISEGVIPSTMTSFNTSAVRAPSAVRIPISRLRPRTTYESTL